MNTKKPINMNVEEQLKEVLPKYFDPLKLRLALFYAQDIMERAVTPFVLLGDTAIQVYNRQEDLKLQFIHLGVVKRYINDVAMSTIRSYARPVIDRNQMLFEYNNEVPIIVDIVEEQDAELYLNPDTVPFYIENFRVPNPFKTYVERFKGD